MLSYQQCLQIATNLLQPGSNDPEYNCIILTEHTIEKPYCFIFFYNNRLFIETGNISYSLAGNSPLFISKLDGSISRYMTALSIEGMIDQHEEEHLVWSLNLSAPLYHDVKKLSSLRNAMTWSLEELLVAKKENRMLLYSGSYNLAEKLKRLLESGGIGATITLNPLYISTDKDFN